MAADMTPKAGFSSLWAFFSWKDGNKKKWNVGIMEYWNDGHGLGLFTQNSIIPTFRYSAIEINKRDLKRLESLFFAIY